MKTTILVVEDDRALRNLISAALGTNEYSYLTVERGEDAIREAANARPDIMVLDLGLPDMDGSQVINRVRAWSNLPIIVVSARCDDRDKIDALDAGADDYLTKPFSVGELLARIRVALRKMQYDNSHEKNEPVFVTGGLKIDYAAGCVYMNGNEIHLTPIEYKLLRLLAKNAGKVLTHNFILKNVWENALESDTPSLRVFMATLRKKLEKDTSHPVYIQTHVGVGYRLNRLPDDQTP